MLKGIMHIPTHIPRYYPLCHSHDPYMPTLTLFYPYQPMSNQLHIIQNSIKDFTFSKPIWSSPSRWQHYSKLTVMLKSGPPGGTYVPLCPSSVTWGGIGRLLACPSSDVQFILFSKLNTWTLDEFKPCPTGWLLTIVVYTPPGEMECIDELIILDQNRTQWHTICEVDDQVPLAVFNTSHLALKPLFLTMHNVDESGPTPLFIRW